MHETIILLVLTRGNRILYRVTREPYTLREVQDLVLDEMKKDPSKVENLVIHRNFDDRLTYEDLTD